MRPGRYVVTDDDLVVMASEAGVLSVPPQKIKRKGRLQPGKMFLVDTVEGRIIADKEIKSRLASRQPYEQWLKENQITLDHLPEPVRVHQSDHATIISRQRAFGYTDEDLKMILEPMAAKGEEPVGSMGTDTPLACLSDKPQPLFNYFKQLFAQVTNPPIDPIREEMVMSLISYIGTERNILNETPENCHTLKLPHPILTNRDLEKLRRVSQGDLLAITLPALFRAADGEAGLRSALDEISRRASLAVKSGYTLLILVRPRCGQRLRANSQPAGAGCGAQSSGPRRDSHPGRADHRIRRTARGHAFCAADRLRRECDQSLPCARNFGRCCRREAICQAA